MSIRLPLKTILSYDDVGQTGTTSLAGGVALPFIIPQDTDNVVVKLSASVIAGGVSATLQTTDDGGTTWYDVARTSIVSNTGASILAGGDINAVWLSVPVIGAGVATGQAYPVTGCILSSGIRATAASALAGGQVSGLPILSEFARVFLIYTAAVSSTDKALVQVKVNSQSATA